MENNKRVGILFSGGLDSTYLVWDNLRKGNEVFPVYFTIKNNFNKPTLEKNRINVLFKSFHETYGDLIRSPEQVITVEVTNAGNDLQLQQVPIWILGLQYSQIHGLDEIQIGYVMNDDAISYIDDIKDIYESYKGISRNQIPITFPLLKSKKEELFNELPKKYRDLTVACENPKIIGDENADVLDYEPCGDCPACERNIKIRNYFNDFPLNYKNVQIENSVHHLEKFGNIIDTKVENNRHFITFEFLNDSDSDPTADLVPESKVKHKQLEFNFSDGNGLDDVKEFLNKK